MNSSHAFPPSTSRHLGDMGNMITNQEGVGSYDSTLNLLDLNGQYSIVGRAVVLHELRDDGAGATGNAGSKLGSCVIGAVNTLPSLPTCPIQVSGTEATVLLTGTAGNTEISGKVNLTYNSGKTTISGSISGLAANSIHGFHIHQYGDLSKDDGTATAGHWNPYNGVHAPLASSTRHAGDLVKKFNFSNHFFLSRETSPQMLKVLQLSLLLQTKFHYLENFQRLEKE